MKQAAYPLALALPLALTVTAAPVGAQEEEEESGGLLVNFLEDTLSGDGQYLKVRGLEGALSSKATIAQITVADDDGVWLTINDAALDWNRLALIRGRFSVNALTAAEILIDRAPAPTQSAEPLPSPEAQPFQVPELPVAIELGEIRVDKLGLGEPLIGLAAELNVLGNLKLADGALDTDLSIKRLDRPGDSIRLSADFQNETSQIGLDLQVVEDQGGLISTALQMPGQPALLITAKGAGPVTDFTADIGVSSEDAQRIAGQVRLQEVPTPGVEDQNSIAFTADLGGDVTPFLEEQFDAFFGTETTLFVDGRSDPGGALEVTELSVNSDALRLKGELAMAAGGVLDKVALQGRITPPDGDNVVLPVANPRITLEAAQLSALLDRKNGNHWIVSLTADGLETPDLLVSEADISASGTLDQGETLTLDGDLQAALGGLVFSDPALNSAVGSEIYLDGFFDLMGEGQLRLTDFELNGDEYQAQLDAAIKGLNSGFEVDGAVNVTASDLSRFSRIAQQDLSGAVMAHLEGTGAPLGGSFDFTLDVEGRDLAAGMPEIDPLIAGKTTINLDAVRNADGLTMRHLAVDAAAMQLEAAAKVSGLDGDLALDGQIALDTPDLALFSGLAGQNLGGAANVRFDGRGAVSGKSFDFKLDVEGQDLSTDMQELSKLVTGNTTITLDAARTGGTVSLRQLKLNSSAATADVTAEVTGVPEDLNGDLTANLAVDGKAQVTAPDLSVFSGLAGQDLGGSVQAGFEGNGALSGKSFDFRLDVAGRDLVTGMEEITKLIAGDATIVLDASRMGDAVSLRQLSLDAPAATVNMAAEITGVPEDLTGDLPTDLAIDGTAQVAAPDLSVFSGLAGQELGGTVRADAEIGGALNGDRFDIKLDLAGRDLSTGMEELSKLLAGNISLTLDAGRMGETVALRQLELDAPAATANITAEIAGVPRDLAKAQPADLVVDGKAQLTAPDLSVFSGLVGQELGGRVEAGFEGNSALTGETFDFKLDVAGRDLSTGMEEISKLIAGNTTITLDAARMGETLSLRQLKLNAPVATADVAAEVTGLPKDLSGDLTANLAVDGTARLNAPDLSVFSGLAGQELGGRVTADLDGSAALADQTFDVKLDLDAQDLRAGIEQVDKLIEGRTTLDMDASKTADGVEIRYFNLNGSALTAEASGALGKDNGGVLTFSAALDELSRITPTLSGPLSLGGDVSQTATGLKGDVQLNGPDSSYAKLAGTVDTDGSADLDFDAELARLERFVPDFPGSLQAKGQASRSGGVWTVDADAAGPGGITTSVAGSFDEANGTADITANGQLNLGIANKFISPNAIKGNASFDLALKGKPGLEGLSGTITTSGTSLAVPAAGQTVTGIGGTVRIANQGATIAINGGLPAGGGFTVSGPVALQPPFDGRITVALNELVLTDNILFETTANGQITMSGPLAGNSSIAGNIVFGETNINLAAASGAVGAAPIPDITHVGASSPVWATLDRANLLKTSEGGGSGPVISLDVGLQAPSKVFARGRGLNAELGGRIHVGGTTSNIVPSGQIELIRGVFDILGRRLALTKGIVTLQGNLTPYLEFESTTTTSDGQATLEIAGPLNAPEVKVFSDPERPSEEALAMLLFGNQFSELSPFVIAQMAASLAQLSGAGGDSTKGLRDATGADTVDLGTDSGGAGRLGAGAYLTDNLYTDFTVNTEGDTEVNLNLDVTDSLTLKGTVDNAGDTTLGVFFKRDY